MSLRSWRKSNELSQAEAAEKLGFTQATICRMERGELPFSMGAALKILRITGERVGPLANKSRQEVALIQKMQAEGVVL